MAIEDFKNDDMFLKSQSNFNRIYTELVEHKEKVDIDLAGMKAEISKLACEVEANGGVTGLHESYEKLQKSFKETHTELDELKSQNERQFSQQLQVQVECQKRYDEFLALK